ncbi:MAG: hypothetical protein LIP06_13195 [Tannerellaceae bacterium]|nr:hypothetical protein [Tannerellaceae bacterium]
MHFKPERKKESGCIDASSIWMALITFLLGFFLIGCADEVGEYAKETGEEESLLRLTITAPGSSLPTTANRVITDPEYVISDIQVLVFAKETGLFKYQVKGEQITTQENNPQKTNFTVSLKTSQEPLRLLLVANAEEAFEKYTPPVGTTEEVMRRRLTNPFAGNYLGGIPMYGEIEVPYLDATAVNTLSATMLRAAGRVDVEVDLDKDKSRAFSLHSVYVFRAKNQVQVIPDQDALAGSDALKVNAPSVPFPVEDVPAYSKVVTTFGQTLVSQLYVPEAEGVDPAADYGRATCIVVGGYYDGEEKLSYYRADFNPDENVYPYGQVLRNHRYHFTIRQVNGAGWETPEEAANNRATTLVVEIKTWEDFTMEMYTHGDNYLGIASREVVFGYQADLRKQVGIQSTVPYKISWEGQSESTTIGGGPVSQEYFTVEIVTYPDHPGDVSYLVFTTRMENQTSADRVSRLKVEWENWIFYVTVTQQYAVAHTERSVRILSVYHGTTGHLGSNTNAADGAGMRAILSNPDYFSPRGIVPYFAGFDFSLAKDQSIFKNADGTNDATFAMLALLYGCDVLYLGNENNISAYAAGKVMEWLRESPNRVLLVGGDAPTTSPGLLRTDKNGLLSDQVDWWYNQMHVDNYQVGYLGGHGEMKFMCPEYDEATNGEFMRGAFTEQFGPVKNSFNRVNIADNYFGYAKTYAGTVVPLLTVTKAPDYMVVGVDKKNRIIYHGDASLYQPAQLEGGSKGVISGNHDKLWANIWAWVASQVIWGDRDLID